MIWNCLIQQVVRNQNVTALTCHSSLQNRNFHQIEMCCRKFSSDFLYAQLLHLGKEYPTGSENFRSKLKTAFSRNAHLRDPAEIETAISRGAFVVKEIEGNYDSRGLHKNQIDFMFDL